MLKMVALLGLVAGAGAYGLYSQTNLFCCHEDNTQACSLSDKKPCCDGTTTAEPSCCGSHSDCCDTTALCCVAGAAVTSPVAKTKSCCDTTATCCEAKPAAAVKTPSCCEAKPAAAVKTPSCCDEPCAACASRSQSAKGAVGGAAAMVAGSLK